MTVRVFAIIIDLLNFNSHAHVERDKFKCTFILYGRISTHTLTWSVTGVTIKALFHSLNFNSHAHVERDDTIIYICDFDKISTHTLTWSVTREICVQFFGLIFQLTRSRGA